MKVDVKLFGPLAEAAGGPSCSVEVPEGATVADVVRAVRALGRAGGDLLEAATVAVNQRYAGAGDPISEGDEVALIPPVSGG